MVMLITVTCNEFYRNFAAAATTDLYVRLNFKYILREITPNRKIQKVDQYLNERILLTNKIDMCVQSKRHESKYPGVRGGEFPILE